MAVWHLCESACVSCVKLFMNRMERTQQQPKFVPEMNQLRAMFFSCLFYLLQYERARVSGLRARATGETD